MLLDAFTFVVGTTFAYSEKDLPFSNSTDE